MSNGENTKVTGWTGWIVFAAALLVLEGILQIFYGLAAILNAHWFVYTSSSAYLIDTSGWGWWLMLVGILLVTTGVLLWTGNIVGRTVGVILAIISAIVNLAVFSVAPLWSLLAIVVDLLVIYAIAVHGREMKGLTQS
jgi:hypothetical protein